MFLIGLATGVILLVRAIQPEAEPERPALQSPPPAPIIPDTARFLTLTLGRDAAPIRMYWRDDDERHLRTLQRVLNYEERNGKRLRFAMNGGMYHKDRSPVGLYIQNGRVLSPLDTSSGAGNFYLKPNGVFLVRKDKTAEVVATERFIYTNDIEFATQSGPMLLIDGAIHPVFEPGSSHLNIRNGVGVCPDGTVIFAMSRDKVTLHEFATYFKALNCRNALYLDGFVSRCYFPEKNWVQLDGDFGVMIGVVE
jgi:uncharacterized protein YigE (DUF2233 family)